MAPQMEHPPFGKSAKMTFLKALNAVIKQLEDARNAGDTDRSRVLEEQEKVVRWKLMKATTPDPEAVAAWHERADKFMGPPPHAR